MSDYRWALEAALLGLLNVVRERGWDVDELTETVADRLLQEPCQAGRHAAKAISEIEQAADALDWPYPRINAYRPRGVNAPNDGYHLRYTSIRVVQDALLSSSIYRLTARASFGVRRGRWYPRRPIAAEAHNN